MRPTTRWVSLCALCLAVLYCSGACARDPQATKERYLKSGDQYAAAGKYAEAIIEYRNALQQDALAGDVREKLAEALLQAGDPANALGEYVRAADLRPDDAALQIKVGNLLLLARAFDEAKSRAEKLLANDDRNVDALILLANSHAGLKDLDGAIAQIEEALRVDPDRSGTYASLGVVELSRGKREAAEQAFRKAVELQPESIAAHLALGNFYGLTGDASAAEKSLLRAVAIEPRSALANRALASFYLSTGRRGSAEQPLKVVYEETRTPAASFALAEYYIAVGNDPAARALLEAMLSDPRASALARVELAALDHKNGRRDDAYTRLAEVLAADRAHLQALLVKSTLLLADGRLDESLASANDAAARHPDSAAAFFMLGRVQASRRQPGAAITAFQEVLRINPRATQAKVALGQLQLAEGRPDTSVNLANEALASEPGNLDAQLLLVRGLLAQGELDRATSALQPLMARYPESSSVHTQMGMLLGRRQNLSGARAAFERALELQPGDLEAFGGLVALDLVGRDFARARARVDQRIASGATAPLLTVAARVYGASGDRAAAETFLRQALDKDGTYLPAYLALGQLYIAQGKLAAARAEFEAVAARSPAPATALTMVGVIFQAEGDVGRARERFERALQIDPEAAVAANNLAWIYAESGGNLDVAMQLAQTAQKHLPDVAEVNDTLGFIYYKKNLPGLAVSTLKLSADKDPANPMYHYHLGLAYVSAGDEASARRSLTRAIELKPDFDGAQDARNLLASLGAR